MPRQYSILGSQRNKSEILKHKAQYCGGKNALICELGHTKIGLKVFVLVIPKEGLANTNPAFWYETDNRIALCYHHRIYCHSLGQVVLAVMRAGILRSHHGYVKHSRSHVQQQCICWGPHPPACDNISQPYDNDKIFRPVSVCR